MAKTRKSTNTAGRPVLVTTEFKGVFFGYADAPPAETMHLKRARLCVYWSSDVRGFMGLAATGPSKHCRIGPAVDITLHGVTSVAECSEAAVNAWEGEPWA